MIYARRRADRLVTGQSPHGSFTILLDMKQGKSVLREKATEVEKRRRQHGLDNSKTDWETGELVAAGDMHAIGEKFAALKHPATLAYKTTADIRRSLSQFEDVDSNNLNLTITTAGGDVLVHLHG